MIAPSSPSAPVVNTLSSSVRPSASPAAVSKNGRCGNANRGRTCLGSTFGSCCSKNNWCGSSKDYCGTGCQSKFGTCSGASSSVLAQPSTTQAPPSSSSSAPVDRVLLPQRDPSVDRSNVRNLTPANHLTLFYAETSPGTYTMLIQAKLTSGKNGILLENIGTLDAVSCSDILGNIRVTFASEAAAMVARNWPSGTVLFTLFDGCNTVSERGVYVLNSSPTLKARAAGNVVDFPVSKSTLQQVVEELDISYGQLVSATDGSQMTSYTTTVTSYFTNPGASTLTSSTFVSTITPSLTTMTYTSTTTSLSDSSSTPSSTRTWALSPSTQAVLEDMSTGLPPAGEDGTINIPISKENDAIIPLQPLGSQPYNEDPQYQAALQAAFEQDAMDPPETLVSDAVNSLRDENSNVAEDSPIKLAVSEYSGTSDEIYDAARSVEVTTTSGTMKRHTPAQAASAPAPRAALGVNAVSTPETKRSLARRDGYDTFFEIMGDDLVGEFCEACGLMLVSP